VKTIETPTSRYNLNRSSLQAACQNSAGKIYILYENFLLTSLEDFARAVGLVDKHMQFALENWSPEQGLMGLSCDTSAAFFVIGFDYSYTSQTDYAHATPWACTELSI
jgi:hypothetical protein